MKRRMVGASVVVLALAAVGMLAWVRAEEPTGAQENKKAATITVKMPANVQLTVVGKERYDVKQMGESRELQTPPLSMDKKHEYTLIWKGADGKEQERTVWVTAGQPHEVNLHAEEEADHTNETFEVSDSVVISGIAKDAKVVEIWYWLPTDSESQKILNLSVKGLTDYKIIQDGPNQYLYAKLTNPNADSLKIETEFTVNCKEVHFPVDGSKVKPLSAAQAKLFKTHLNENVPNMEVNADIRALLKEILKGETNPQQQVEKIYEWMVDNTFDIDTPEGKQKVKESSDKLGFDELMKKRGSADHCHKHKGGSCIDQHALFCALVRGCGIPTRLQFGSHVEEEEHTGKETDPGYHCWAQYFLPGYGWIPVDVSEGSANKKDAKKRKFFQSGIDAHRICYFEGRNTVLKTENAGDSKEGGAEEKKEARQPLNLMIVAHVEVDKKELDPREFKRTVKITEPKK